LKRTGERESLRGRCENEVLVAWLAAAIHKGKKRSVEEMRFRRSVLGGLAGGWVMIIALAIARAAGLTRLDLTMWIGSFVVLSPGPIAWIVGAILELLASAAISVVYGLCFEFLTHRANVWIGTLFGGMQAIVVGFAIMFLAFMNPFMYRAPGPAPAGRLLTPGAFAANYGSVTVFGLVGLIILFGAIRGAVYGSSSPLKHSPGGWRHTS